MKYLLLLLTLVGITASTLALHERYRPYGDSPCNFNDRWDCGIVNHSPYAVIRGLPVAVIGIAGYLVLALLALRRAYRVMLALALPALAFSLYLAHIERDVLGVWCLYCVISLSAISLVSALLLGTVAAQVFRKPVG